MNRQWLGLGLAVWMVCVATAPAAEKGSAFDFRHGFSSVAKKVTPAVVFIQVEKQVKAPDGGQMFFFQNPNDLDPDDLLERFFGNGRGPMQRRGQPGAGRRPFLQMGQGSGFIITKDGYILTNTHVVDDADKIRVRLNNGKEYTAKRIGSDPRTEVAVIKIDARDLPTVEMGDVSKLETGEWVVAIGNPFGLAETLTVGVVSAKGRNNIGIADYEDFIQTDAAINPGNSGGPLLNIDGEVVGINTAIFSRNGGTMGIGFAVPIDMAIAVKDQLVKHGKMTRGFIGVTLNPGVIDEEMAKSLGLKQPGGALIADTVEEGPAASAGIKGGDVVVAVDGRPIADSRTLRNEIARIVPGTDVKLTVMRDGEARKITVKAGTFPEDGKGVSAQAGAEKAPSLVEKLGLHVQDLTADLARRFGYETKRGVILTDIEDGSPAARAGLEAGNLIMSVNRKDVSNVEDFQKAVKAGEGNKLLLRVRSAEGVRFVLLVLED